MDYSPGLTYAAIQAFDEKTFAKFRQADANPSDEMINMLNSLVMDIGSPVRIGADDDEDDDETNEMPEMLDRDDDGHAADVEQAAVTL